MTRRDGTGPKTVAARGEEALVLVMRVWIAAAMLIAPVLVFLGGAVWCALVIRGSRALSSLRRGRWVHECGRLAGLVEFHAAVCRRGPSSPAGGRPGRMPVFGCFLPDLPEPSRVIRTLGGSGLFGS